MNWSSATLGAVSTLGPQYGANASATAATGARPRFVRITDIDEDGRLKPDTGVEADIPDADKYQLEEGDLLFARTGSVGRCYCYTLADGDCIFAGYLIRFRVDSRVVLPRYIWYYARSPKYRMWVATRQRVAIQANINGTEYASLDVPLPAPREQGRIVELLEQADIVRRQRAEADALAARILPALFAKMFGDPVTNPKDWPIQPLGEIAEFISGGTPLKERKDYWNGEVPWVSAKDMKTLEVTDTVDHISETALRETNVKVIHPGAVLIVVRGMILAHTVPIALNRVPLTINQDMKALVPRDGVPAEFLQWALLAQHQKLLRLVSTAAHGTRKLDTEALAALPIPVPTMLLDKFVEYARQQSLAREFRRNVAASIETLFRTMLHRAFTGELTARWRDAHMKELLVEMEQQARALNVGKNGTE